MILVLPEMKKIINLGYGSWCYVQCAYQDIWEKDADPAIAPPKERKHLITFALASGIDHVAYVSEQDRDNAFEAIRKTLLLEAGVEEERSGLRVPRGGGKVERR